MNNVKKRTKNFLKIEAQKKAKQIKIDKAKFDIRSAVMASVTMCELYGDLDLATVVDELYKSVDRLSLDNLNEIEYMLMMQTKTLDLFFYQTLKQIPGLKITNHVQLYTDIALRAQNQSRKTLLALANLKNPKKAMFVKQQNVAVNQQVINDSKLDNESDKNIKKVANELLKERNNETLDFRGTPTSSRANQIMATMEVSRC